MSRVVVIAHDAEGISAAFRTAVGTDRSAAVRASRHGCLAARDPNVIISEFNLTGGLHGLPAIRNRSPGHSVGTKKHRVHPQTDCGSQSLDWVANNCLER